MTNGISSGIPAVVLPQTSRAAATPAEVAAPSTDRFEQRSIDGSGNNRLHPDFNQAGTALIRKTAPAFADGVSAPSGADRPGPREISNAVLAQTSDKPDQFDWSGMLWGWGQFIDHDMTHTAEVSTGWNKIPVPTGDPYFDPQGTGKAFIPYNPTDPARGTGAGTGVPFQPWNTNTGWIDGSMVYGSDTATADALRSHAGGTLKMGDYSNLPWNTLGVQMDNPLRVPDDKLLAAGDVRANENPVLVSLQTVFMREHNRQCAELAKHHPEWNDQQLYDGARKRVGALIEAITYQEYLPNLLGPTRMPDYKGYDAQTDPRMAIEFSSAGFRLGHSQLGGTIFRNDPDTDMIAQGDIKLRDAYFQPARTLNEGGVAATLRGACDYVEQATDAYMVDDVRNFLFGPPGAGGMDLGAINITRGREHGLPDFNSVRKSYGLQPIADFDALTNNKETADHLRSVYGSIDKLDPWVGMLAEHADEGTVVGNTVRHVISDQFTRLRDGDRFYYENDPELAEEAENIKNTTLSRVISRNLGENFQPYAFHGKEIVRD